MLPSHYFERRFAPEYLYPPTDFCSLSVALRQHRQLSLEIGAGKGRHAAAFATAHPNAHLIAIERTKHKFLALQKLAQSEKLANLTCVHADAIPWAVYALPPNSLSSVYILYPNPEPHNKNQRFVNMPFFEFLLSRMKQGARIYLASNIKGYIDEAKKQLTDIWQLPFTCVSIDKTSKRTHFEIKYLARGETCFELAIIKPVGYKTRFDSYDNTRDDKSDKAKGVL